MSTPLHNDGIKPPTPGVTPPTTPPVANPAAEVASIMKNAQAQAMAAPKPTTPTPSPSTAGTAAIKKAWSEKILPDDANIFNAIKTGIGKAFDSALKLFSTTKKPVSAETELETMYQTQQKRADSLISIGRAVHTLAEAVGFAKKTDAAFLQNIDTMTTDQFNRATTTKQEFERIYTTSTNKGWDLGIKGASLGARFETLSVEIGKMKDRALNLVKSDDMNSLSTKERRAVEAELKKQFKELNNYHSSDSVYLQNRNSSLFGSEIKGIITKIQVLMEKAGVGQSEKSQMERAGFKEEDAALNIKNGIANFFTKMLGKIAVPGQRTSSSADFTPVIALHNQLNALTPESKAAYEQAQNDKKKMLDALDEFPADHRELLLAGLRTQAGANSPLVAAFEERHRQLKAQER